ncbi:MAG TPA: DUF1273 family protein [Oscillatoriales cyanobacterium M59_W2019_021]|nr:DUF1273 family protein [Oscillatoriales cyanobacterium M59_W2019_021]
MAIGVDQYAAGICYRRQLPYHVVLPCADQYRLWPDRWQQNWKFLVKHAATVETLHPSYVNGCLHQRNNVMISRSQICLAVWDGRSSGGTVHAVTKARKHGLKILVFNPTSLVISDLDD